MNIQRNTNQLIALIGSAKGLQNYNRQIAVKNAQEEEKRKLAQEKEKERKLERKETLDVMRELTETMQGMIEQRERHTDFRREIQTPTGALLDAGGKPIIKGD